MSPRSERELLYEEYLNTVLRCKDGTPAVDFEFWCWQHGIEIY